MSPRIKLTAERAARIRELRSQGMTVAGIAQQVGVGPRTVYNVLAERPRATTARQRRPRFTPPMIVEALMTYYVRYGERPTTVLLNTTKARARGPDTIRRLREGWRPVDGSLPDGEVYPYPRPDEFGPHNFVSLDDAWKATIKELERLRRAGTPYEPAPLPPEAVRLAQMASTAPPPVLLHPQGESGVPPEPDHLVAIADVPGHGPIVAGFPHERRHTAVIGDARASKTSLMWRFALGDTRYGTSPVVILDSSPADVAGIVHHYEPNIEVVPASIGVEEMRAILARRPKALVAFADETPVRQFFLRTLLAIGWPMSLVIDDADDVLGDLRDLCETKGSGIVVTASWCPIYRADHLATLQAFGTWWPLPIADASLRFWLAAEIQWREVTGQ